jgi:hypothetical protein
MAMVKNSLILLRFYGFERAYIFGVYIAMIDKKNIM